MMHNTETKSGSTETTMGPLSIDGAQPAWMTLNDAREQSFTGEVVFEADPDVLAYLDHGVVYYAESADGPSLGQRLLEAGLIDAGQLERGMVRVGDIEHLGRMFDRDPSIDRDAVLVVTETLTEDVILRLANESIATVRATAYRHHPSGLHRWFAAPVDAAAAPRPVGAVSPLDAAILDDLPGTGRSVDDLVEELTIEWDEPLDGLDEIEVLPAVDRDEIEVLPAVDRDDAVVDPVDDVAVEDTTAVLDMGGYVDLDTDDTSEVIEYSDETVETADAESADVDDDELSLATELDAEGQFEVIWPNGTVEVATDAEVRIDDDLDEVVIEIDDDGVEVADVEQPAADLHFDLPDVIVDEDEDVVTEDVDDDVADAVRRALAAIETASVVAPVDEAPAVAGHLDLDESTETAVHADPAPNATPMSPFAPPTLDMAAEAIYARATEPTQAAEQPTLPTVAPGQNAAADESNDRSSALRRLIRSLGRKER